jgi:hypothetical protein
MPPSALPSITIGDPTKKSHYDAISTWITYLNSQLGIVNSAGSILTNGSFETDSDSNGVPDGWSKLNQTGGSGELTGNGLTDTACNSGNRAWKCTSPGGGSNGGCEMQSGFFEVSPLRPLAISWMWYSTAATTANKVEIDYYDASQTFVSPTVTVFSQSAGNPSSWTSGFAMSAPPSTARFAKLTFIGCDSSSTTAGSTYWDSIVVTPIDFKRRTEFHAVGSNTRTWEWKAQFTGPHRITCIGGGASGSHNSGATLQPGGGSGELAQSIVMLTSGTAYTVVAGGAGAAASSSAGNNGADSTFATTTVVGKGGSKGIINSTGGAGGTGGTGTIKVSGCPGDTPAGGRNGNGGDSVFGKAGGIGGTTGVIAIAPLEYSGGAGGAGSNNASESGCIGGSGLVIIEW